MESKILKIEGITCAACAKNIERATRKLNGVIEALEMIRKRCIILKENQE